MTGAPEESAVGGSPGGPSAGPGRGRPRLLRGLLIASLAVNLFLGGVLIGGALIGRPAHLLGGGFDSLMALREAAMALPDDGPAVLRGAFLERRGDLFGEVRGLHAARRDVRAAMTEEPFDPDRVAAAFATLRGQTADLQTLVHETLAQAMADLTPEQRHLFAEALARRGGGHGDRGDGSRGPHRRDAPPAQ